MKTRALPLAAALALAAAAAQAQLLNPSPAPGNFGSAPGGVFSLSGGASGGVSDVTFKCGTVPWRVCTSEDLAHQQRIKAAGRCPMTPASAACTDFLMRNGSGQNPALRGGDPLADVEPFYKKCGKVPYRLCTPEEDRQRAEAEKVEVMELPEIVVTGRRYDQEPGFIGPPAPQNVSRGIGMVGSIEDVRKEHPDAIDLGPGQFGIPDPNDPSKLEVCTSVGCQQRNASEFQAQIDAARADANMFTGSSGGGQSRTPAPVKATPGNGGAERAGVTTPPGGGADQDAVDVAAAQGQIGRSVNATGAGVGWTGTGAGSADATAVGASGGTSEVIKIDGATIARPDDIEVTFTGNQRMLRQLDSTAQDMTTGQVEELITIDGQTSAAKRGRLEEPPVDPNALGKQQFNSNK